MVIKKSYVPKLSLRKTIEYCNKFQKIVYDCINQKYEIFEVNLPLISEINNGINTISHKKRNINFDNWNNNIVYELMQNYENIIYYYVWNLKLVENECLFTRYTYIERDLKPNKNTPLQKNISSYNFVIQEEDRNNETLFMFSKMFINAFDTAINKLQDIYKIKSFFKDVKMYDLKNIKKSYPFLDYSEALNRFIASNRIAIISNIINEFNDVKINNDNIADGYDWENTISLYVFDENTESILNIMTCTISPSWNIYTKQKRIYGQGIPNNDFIDKLKSEKYTIVANVKINFDLIFYLFLDKMDINELPSINNKFNINELYKNFK